MIEQATLAQDIAKKIPYEFNREFLVKPLPVEKIKKEFTVPVSNDTTTDENGIEATDFNETKTEVKEVDSDFQKGIVLKLPHEYNNHVTSDTYKPMEIFVGDTIIFRRSNKYFDLVKDTMLIGQFDIIAVEHTSGI